MYLYCPACRTTSVASTVRECPMDGPWFKCKNCGFEYIWYDMAEAVCNKITPPPPPNEEVVPILPRLTEEREVGILRSLFRMLW
jgi:NAD-dependent SIR2 family protein deacetylase